jgi:hypothetical protein
MLIVHIYVECVEEISVDTKLDERARVMDILLQRGYLPCLTNMLWQCVVSVSLVVSEITSTSNAVSIFPNL